MAKKTNDQRSQRRREEKRGQRSRRGRGRDTGRRRSRSGEVAARPASSLPTDILSYVPAVIKRIERLGLDWSNSRFGRYAEITASHRTPTRAFLDAYHQDDSLKELTFEAGAQLIQLLMAATVWDNFNTALLKRTAAEVLKGEPLTADPDDKPRNSLLELVTAALLADQGFGVQLTKEREDVRLSCPGLPNGAAECKRPLTVDGVQQNLQKIGGQLRRRKRAGAGFGVAVIGADRAARDGSPQRCIRRPSNRGGGNPRRTLPSSAA